VNADCSLASLTHRRIQIMGASFIIIIEHSVYIPLFFWKKKKVLLEYSCFTILCYFSAFIKPSFKTLSAVKGKDRPFSLWSWTAHIKQYLFVFDLKEFKWAPHNLWSHLSPFLSHIYLDHHWAHFFTYQFCSHIRQAGVSFLRKRSFKTAPKIIFYLMYVKCFCPLAG